MSESARRELARELRTSSIVRRVEPAVWALDWVEARAEAGGGFSLGVWFSCSAPLTVPPGLSTDDFALETSDGLTAHGWQLSSLATLEDHATLHLSRSPAASAWTDASLVIVYRGPLDQASGSVDPLRDRRELVFSAPLPPLEAAERAPLSGESVVGDFAMTRANLLDRLALLAPEWQERSEADPWMALVDLLAWAGDRLAAYQDAVATEAWLATARRRLSVRRHARLLGFVAHDGCSARAWLHLCPDVACSLPAGACFATRRFARPGERDARVFHTLETATLRPNLEALELYRWGATSWVLAAGSCQLALVGTAPGLQPGQPLLLPGPHVARIAELSREQDPLTQDWITRVTLYAEDALPAALQVDGQTASANVVLAAEGAPFELGERPEVTVTGRVRYALRGRTLARAEPFDAARARHTAAAHALLQVPERASFELSVCEHRPGGRQLAWEVRRDLLESGPYDRHFVAELDDDVLELRFGDGVNGRPAPSAALLRVTAHGAGPASGATDPAAPLHPLDEVGFTGRARIARESPALDAVPSSRVRLEAPALARVLDVCQHEADYARYAREVAGVLDAHSELRWTGSWYTACVWVLPQASDVLGPELAGAVQRRLERVRQLGVALEVRAPRYVVGEIVLQVEVTPDAALAGVDRALRGQLGNAGFLSREALRLGASLASGTLVSTALAVRGVSDVRLRRFRREDDPRDGVRDWITVAPYEVLRVGVVGSEPITLELVRS